jgi:hypothetical protein
MAILFMGNEDIDFPIQVSGPSWTTDSQYYRTGYQRCAVLFPNSVFTGQKVGSTFTASGRVWLSWRMIANIGFRGAWATECAALYDGAAKRVALVGNGGRVSQIISYDDSGHATAVSTSSAMINNQLTRYDWLVDYAGGVTELYENGFLIASFTGSLSTISSTTLNKFTLGNINENPDYYTCVSEVIVADEDTRALNLVALVPTANGVSHTDWSGSVTDINEVTANTSTVITSGNSVDQVQSYTVSNLPSTNTAIRCVQISASALRGATGPTALQLGANTTDINGTGEGFSANLALSTSFSTLKNIFYDNPAFANTAWTVNAVNNMEVLIKSKV